MLSKPLVSIVIPFYNPGDFLNRALNSVMDQSYKRWETLLVNDGSSIEENSRIAQMASCDGRIRYYSQINKGVASARNLGFSYSNGVFLAFLDADDLWHPDNLAKKVHCLVNNPKVGLVHGDMQIIDESDTKKSEVLIGKEGKVLDDLLLWESTVIPAPSSILVRRSVIKEIGLFDEELSTAADQEFFFRVASRYSVARIPETLGFYRMHGKNMSKMYSLFETDHQLAYQKARSNSLFKNWIFRRRCFSNMYMIIAGVWWGDGQNKGRGIKFVIKSLLVYPLNFFKLTGKVLSRI